MNLPVNVHGKEKFINSCQLLFFARYLDDNQLIELQTRVFRMNTRLSYL